MLFLCKLCSVLVIFSENSTHQPRNWRGQTVDFLHQSRFYSTQEPGFRTKKDRFLIVSPNANMDSLIINLSSTEVEEMSGTYSHNRMPFSRPLRKPLSPKLLPVTA